MNEPYVVCKKELTEGAGLDDSITVGSKYEVQSYFVSEDYETILIIDNQGRNHNFTSDYVSEYFEVVGDLSQVVEVI